MNERRRSSLRSYVEHGRLSDFTQSCLEHMVTNRELAQPTARSHSEAAACLAERPFRVRHGAANREQGLTELREPRATQLPLPLVFQAPDRGSYRPNGCLSPVREMNEARAPVGGIAAPLQVALPLELANQLGDCLAAHPGTVG